MQQTLTQPPLVSWRRAAVLTAAIWGPGFILSLVLGASAGSPVSAEAVLIQLAACACGAALGIGINGVLSWTGAWRPGLRIGAIGFYLAAVIVVQALIDVKLRTASEAFHHVTVAGAAALMPRAIFSYFWLFSLNLTLLLLASAAERVRTQERALAEATMTAQQAQIAALRLQLNPHFLFNTLNAISTLVIEGRSAQAETMIGRLSDFLRASLSMEPAELIPLEDELDTISAYLEIERVRFDERLVVDYAIAPGLADALTPSLLLQPLVENAIKYGVAATKKTVTIRIEATAEGDELVLMVEDDAPAEAASAIAGGPGVGLSNIRRRLEALYGARGVLQTVQREGGFLAMIRLPLERRARARAAA